MDQNEVLHRTVKVLGIADGYRFDAAMIEIQGTGLGVSADGLYGVLTDAPIDPPIHFLFMCRPIGGGPMAVAEYLWDGQTLTTYIPVDPVAPHEQ
jgi:hypothetical protein